MVQQQGGLRRTVATGQAKQLYTVYLNDARMFVLPIGPEETQQIDPTRTATVNTLAGAYQEAWGAGIGTYILSGVTGWGTEPVNDTDGFGLIRLMWGVHRQYQNLLATSDPALVNLLLVVPPFFEMPDVAADTPAVALPSTSGSAGAGMVYRVSSDELRTDRNKSSPLLWRFRWTLTILEDRFNPATAPSGRFSLAPTDTGAPPNETPDVPPPDGDPLGIPPNPLGLPGTNPLVPLRGPPGGGGGGGDGRDTALAPPAGLSLAALAGRLGLAGDQTVALARQNGLALRGPLPAGLPVIVPASTRLA